jgi:hypothetical protein
MTITLGLAKPSFVIDSQKRDSGSIENFNYTIDINIDDDNYTQCAVTSCTIPKSYYDLAVDSELTVYEDGVSRTIVIPKGNYGVNSIQNILIKLLNFPAIDDPTKPIYQMCYPDCRLENDTNRFTWTVNKDTGDPTSDPPVVGIFPITWQIKGDNRLHDILGFDKDISGTTIIPFIYGELTSLNAINLEHTKFIVIKSDMVHNEGAKDLDTAILCRIPIDDTDKTVIHYRLLELEDELKSLVNNKNNQYRFSVYDDDNRLLDLNGNNWSLTLFFSKYNYHDEMSIKYMKMKTIESI